MREWHWPTGAPVAGALSLGIVLALDYAESGALLAAADREVVVLSAGAARDRVLAVDAGSVVQAMRLLGGWLATGGAANEAKLWRCDGI